MHKRYLHILSMGWFPFCTVLVGGWIVTSLLGLGIGIGFANPGMGVGLERNPFPPRYQIGSNYVLDREADKGSFINKLEKFDLDQDSAQSSSESEHINLPILLSPDDRIDQFAQTVNFQQSPERSLFTVDFYFDIDRVKLGEELAQSFEKTVQSRAARNNRVYIEAYCDERGGMEYSLVLGERRLQSVKQYLIDLGVFPQVIESVNYGSSRPPCKEATDPCNRHKLKIQSIFKFFAINNPQLGCLVRLQLHDSSLPSEKSGLSGKSELPYHTRLAPLRWMR